MNPIACLHVILWWQEYESHRQQHEEVKKYKDKKVEELKAARSKLYPLDKKIDALKKKKEEMDAQMKSKVFTYDFHVQ